VTDRTSYVLFAALAALLTTANIAIKPTIDAESIHRAAEFFGTAGALTGTVADDFDLPLRDGRTFRLADHAGRDIVVLNFFTTWCQPCREEMPELARYAARHAAAPAVLLVAIDVEEQPEEVDQLVRRLGLTIAVGIDARGRIARQFAVNGFPTTVLIGADGRIKLYQAGAIRNADAALRRIVDAESAALADPRHDWHAEYLANSATSAPGRAPRRGFTPPDEKGGDDALSRRDR
jgi:cytochrome c biogenesis protein CcmG, thiol:disulfide interchange protein DsbE